MDMNTDDQPQVPEDGQVDAATRSVSLRRLLADSIYLWACGEKDENDEHDPKLSDMLIGWLILVVQGLAYGMFIVLARSTTSSDTGSTEEAYSGGSYTSYTSSAEYPNSGGRAEFVMPSVSGAIYLLMVSTSHDLRAGFSLLVDGARAGHRAFGAGLLVVYVIMTWSAFTVLTSTSNDSVSILLNAVAVLFIADLDEKALKFFSTIPPNWRVFWAMEFFGISLSLTLVAVSSIGVSFPLLEDNGFSLRGYPTWIVWVLNPTVVTICSYILSSGLHNWFESCSAALPSVDSMTFSSAVSRAGSGALASLQHTKESLRREPVFYLVLSVWLVHGVFTESYDILVLSEFNTSLNLYVCLGSGTSITLCINETESIYPYIINAVLVAGIAMKALGRYLPRPTRVSALQEPCRSSDAIRDRNIPVSWATESRLPSLLVGLAVGYWIAALLVVLASSWPGGSWYDPPTALSVVGYVCLPCFALVSLFMVVDTNVFGVKFATFIKPVVDMLLDRRNIVYWVMMAVFRDAFLMWAILNVYLAIYFNG